MSRVEFYLDYARPFGSPTFFVGDEPFWGHDRRDYLARAAGVA